MKNALILRNFKSLLNAYMQLIRPTVSKMKNAIQNKQRMKRNFQRKELIKQAKRLSHNYIFTNFMFLRFLFSVYANLENKNTKFYFFFVLISLDITIAVVSKVFIG